MATDLRKLYLGPTQVALNDPTTMAILASIGQLEGGGQYNPKLSAGMKGTASGAYGMLDSTWRSYARRVPGAANYARAGQAPPGVQDRVAAELLKDALKVTGGS